jgi:hypothetical protein
MRGVLAFACRAFPPAHRARQSDEVVDTALLAADGSARREAREAVSLVVAGLRQRLRSESDRPLRDGFTALALVLAVVNLAVALAGSTRGIDRSPFVNYGPYAVDLWWIVFTVAAAFIVLGLVLGNRWIAIDAALVNLGLIAFDAVFLANGNPYDGQGHFDVYTYSQTSSFPGGRQWLAAAVVLAIATAAASPRRIRATRLPLILALVLALVVVARETWGVFFFLRWPLALIVLLAVAFGAVVLWLAVLGIGVTLAAAPSAVAYLTAPNLQHDPVVTAVVAAGLALGVLLPLAYLTRRRLT